MKEKKPVAAHFHECGGGACPVTWRCRAKWCADKRIRFCAICKESRRRAAASDSSIRGISRVQQMNFKAGLERAMGRRDYIGGPLPGKTFAECLEMSDCPVCSRPPGCCHCTEEEKKRATDRRVEAQWNEGGKPLRLRKERPRKGHQHFCPGCKKKRSCHQSRASHPAGIVYRLTCDSCRILEEARQERARRREVRSLRIVMRQ